MKSLPIISWFATNELPQDIDRYDIPLDHAIEGV